MIISSLKVEVKPYVLDDQLCDECQGARCGGKFAPFFCANVTCLQVRKRMWMEEGLIKRNVPSALRSRFRPLLVAV